MTGCFIFKLSRGQVRNRVFRSEMRSQQSVTEIASQLRRAGLSINSNIAEGTGRFGKHDRRCLLIAREPALECAAVLDAMQVVGLADPRIPNGHTLRVRLVSMLAKIIG